MCISLYILIIISLFIISPIIHLFNVSLSEGSFSIMLKTNIVKLLFKNRDRMSVNNYRPIFEKQLGLIVFLNSNIYLTTKWFQKMKIYLFRVI